MSAIQQQPVSDTFAAVRDLVFIHASDNRRAHELVPYGDGIVLRGRRGYAVARTWREPIPLIVDPERYGRDRGDDSARLLLDESPDEAVRSQLRTGAACLLAPSRFPVDRSASSIRSVLAAGEEFVDAARQIAPQIPAFVPIVVRYDELSTRALTDAVVDADLPIATVFAGVRNPLSHPGALAGAVELIKAAPAALVLRCDVSVAGFAAVGAVAGAIGATSGVRHLFLPTRNGNHARRPARALLVPRFGSWIKEEFIEMAQAEPDLDNLFRCECTVCGPGGDVRDLVLPEVDLRLRDHHSIAAAVDIARSVVRAQDRLGAWHNLCLQAVHAYEALDELRIDGPTGRDVFQGWMDVIGSAS